MGLFLVPFCLLRDMQHGACAACAAPRIMWPELCLIPWHRLGLSAPSDDRAVHDLASNELVATCITHKIKGTMCVTE